MKLANLLATMLASIFSIAAVQAADNVPSNAELYEIIQAQQEEIDSLKQERSGSGLGENLHLGGYGELHYNNVSGQPDELDFHRFVLFFGYDFSERIRMRSEFELEHAVAGDGKNGEVEIEQAYIEGDISKNLQAKAGVFLIPVGILNETHEPPTFYGVERNNVEKSIIPTTWWEGGVAANGRHGGGFSWDFAFHSGLNLPTTGGNAYKIRNGRQKASEANASSGAVTGRVKYAGLPGLEVAASVNHQFDAAQGNEPTNDDVDATLYTAHIIFNRGIFGSRALYAHWDLSGDAPIALGRDEQSGGYLEGSIKPIDELGFYARVSQWDNEAGNTMDTETNRLEAGVNYWPHPDVVFKFDVFTQEKANENTDGFNLGMGYQFGS